MPCEIMRDALYLHVWIMFSEHLPSLWRRCLQDTISFTLLSARHADMAILLPQTIVHHGHYALIILVLHACSLFTCDVALLLPVQSLATLLLVHKVYIHVPMKTISTGMFWSRAFDDTLLYCSSPKQFEYVPGFQ